MTLKTVKVYVIEPKEATNLITNPSFEVATTGYTLLQSTIARVTTQQRRGVASLGITPTANQIAGAYYTIALTSGTSYTFSCDVLDVLGQSFYLRVNDTGGVQATGTAWTGTGYWKRRSITFTPDATENHTIYLCRASVNSTTVFYTDGWQLETGAESTYLDGDMVGYVTGQTAYRWNGTRHASTSWRSAQTRSGGTYLDISSYARLLAIAGLGMASLSNIAIPSTLGGSYYQNTVSNERAFSLVLNFAGSGDYAETERDKKEIIDAIKPDATIYRQPLLLQVDQLDTNALECAETLMIPCVYESGLEMDGDGDNYTERVALTFRQFMPLIQQQGEKGVALGYATAVADADYVAFRDSTGVWHNVSTAFNSDVYALAKGLDGKIYIAGNFTDVGDASGDRIVSWNGTALASLGSGGGTAYIRRLAVGPDGSVYAVGLSENIGGVAAADYIAKWNGTEWSALGSGTGAIVNAVAVGNDGSLYAGGEFTNLTDANGDYISKWNGSAWSSLGTGMQSIVYALKIGPDGYLYAGGVFTTAGGTTVNGIAKWNGTAWSGFGTGVAGGLATVFTINFDDAGNMYIGGSFTSVNGISANYIAKWNGATWSALGDGVNNTVSASYYRNSVLYICGAFTASGTTTITDKIAMWNGSSWSSIDIDLPGTPTVHAILEDVDGLLYVGFSTAGAAASATVTASNVGSAATHPRITMTGPGAISQLKNYTTGKGIFFNLTLLAGEVATLNLDPLNISFTSSFRGNIMSTILPGSDLNWELQPGANNVSSFIYSGSTAASGIVMVWSDQYWSIDGAIR